MRLLPSVLLAASYAFAYQVTSPGGSQGWNTTGPNILVWDRVDTDPTNFTAVLTNENSPYSEIMDNFVDGTAGIASCSTPAGGWPSGSNFRVNLVQDANNIDAILAQSSEFNITNVSSSGSTTSAPSQTTASATGTTSNSPSVSSSDTSTTPTGSSAASRGIDTQTGLFTVVAVLSALLGALF